MNDTLQILLQFVLKTIGPILVTRGVLTAPDAATAATQVPVILGAAMSLAGLGWHFSHFFSPPSQTPPPPPSPSVKTLGLMLCCAALAVAAVGCGSAGSAALKANGAAITAVQTAMEEWGAFTRAGHGTDAQIITVSNAYNAYFDAELTASNTVAIAVTQTNDTVVQTALAAVQASQTNLLNLIRAFQK